jgi:oxygen-independent coproporphyrinogen-3 oxidase
MSQPYPIKDNEFVAWYPLDLTAEHAQSTWVGRRTGYYVHIPFCTAICDYCGFAVEKMKGAGVTSYLDALRMEIERYISAGRLAGRRFVCGHFGGGTPSAIDATALMSIKGLIDSACDVVGDAEVTVEVNPISFTLEKARIYREGGVSRISVGVQSFNDVTLKTIGRPHRAKDVQKSLAIIGDVGWDNFSLDLIYGVPGQTAGDLRADLFKAVDTGASHLSCFRLEIIPLTVLRLREAAGLLPARLSAEELNAMDDVVHDVLTSNGYEHYGAFNYARPGYESVHNDIAFVAPQGEYIGFGNSSYSFVNDHIYCNYAEVEAYMQAVAEGRDPIALSARVTALELMSRFFVLGLKFFRVSRSAFAREFGMEPEDVFGPVLSDLLKRGLLTALDDEYVLTSDGRRYVNNVVKEFFVGASRGQSQYHQVTSTLTVEQIMRYARLGDGAAGGDDQLISSS